MIEEANDDGTSLGVIKELGELPADTVVSEQALAKIFSRHKVSIKRAVERRELPPSIRLFGEPVWTIQALREHFNKRIDEAKRESEKLRKKIDELSA